MAFFDFLRRPTQAEEVGYPNVAPEGAFTYQDPLKGAGFMDRINYWQQNNPEVLMNFAAGMFAGDTGKAIAGAGEAMSDTRKEEQQKQALATQQNSTLQYLISKGVDPTEARAAMNDPVILKHLLQMTENAANPDFASTAYGTPIWMINPTTNEMDIGAMSKADGSLLLKGKPAPPGWRPATLQEQSYQKGYGNADAGEAVKVATDYRRAKAQLPVLRQNLQRLAGYSKNATFTIFDRAWDATARQFKQTTEGAEARVAFNSLAENTIIGGLRTALGPQFTENEHAMIRQTLGSEDMSPIEKLRAIDDYMFFKEQQLKGLAAEVMSLPRVPGTPEADPGAPALEDNSDPAGLFR